MTDRCWLAQYPQPPPDAAASATLAEGGSPAGFLVAWNAHDEPQPGAVKVDPRAIDPDGGPCWASLVLAGRGTWLPFDDVAVSHAMRETLAHSRYDLVSTLVVGDDRFAGAISAMHGDDPGPLADDPFARLFPARLVRVGPGLLGRPPTPVGPPIQRYGPANPWPWDRFA